MSEGAPEEELFDVECPHCKRRFQAKLVAPRSARHAGFKCPHCKLFVAFERAADAENGAG